MLLRYSRPTWLPHYMSSPSQFDTTPLNLSWRLATLTSEISRSTISWYVTINAASESAQAVPPSDITAYGRSTRQEPYQEQDLQCQTSPLVVPVHQHVVRCELLITLCHWMLRLSSTNITITDVRRSFTGAEHTLETTHTKPSTYSRTPRTHPINYHSKTRKRT